MAKAKTKAEEPTTDGIPMAERVDFPPKEEDVFDQAIRAQQAAQVVEKVAAATEMPEHTNGHSPAAPASTHAATVVRKKYEAPKDPYGFENIKAGENRVQLLKSEGEGAWVIRFAHNPNEDKGQNGETYSKASPHPVLKMLKEEGYRWHFDGGDGKGGWGKAFSGDAYVTDHMEARRVLQQAAEMIGQPKEQGIPL